MPDVVTTPRRNPMPRALGWLAIPLAALVACSPGPSPAGPTPSPSAGAASPAASVDAAAVYAAIAAQVEAIRGLEPKGDVAPVLLDETQLRANLTADFDTDNPTAQITASEQVLVTLGLLPVGTSLRQAYLDLQAGQVAGYYSPDRDQLFVVSRSGAIGATQRVTYAHEFTHQLQDQNFDLSKLGLDATDQGDRSLARLSLVEGDAVATQTAWMSTNLTPQDIAAVFADASDPAAVAALEHAPAILRTTSLSPYTDGFAFVGTLKGRGGEAAVNAAFADPPDSTEQILHPEKYLTRERPIAVTLPAHLETSLGAGWSATAQDTLGELVLREWLVEGGVQTTTAATAAAGWGGDRLELLTGPNGDLALGLVTTWDTAADAAEFALAAGQALSHVHGESRLSMPAAAATVRVVIATTSGELQDLLGALGG
ncbi:MAG TPA: hypothetical protein VNH13_07010 [Candidatus Acidoferrales bacterium]|nr:hypothetical protein [Candidatus Acidoferrales bacterium]